MSMRSTQETSGLQAGTPQPPPTPKGRDTRQRLLAAGRRLFGEVGYANVRIADITAAAGLSQGAYYRYFTDRRELMLELLRDLTSEAFDFARVPSDTASSITWVLETTRRYFEFFEKNRSLFGVLVELAQTDPDVAEIGSRSRTRFYGRIAHALAKGIEEGTVRPDLDVTTAAELLGSMSEFYAYQRFVLTSSALRETPITQVAQTLATVWANGVGIEER